MRYMMLIKHPGDYDVNKVPPSLMELHRIHWPEFKGESEIRPLEESA